MDSGLKTAVLPYVVALAETVLRSEFGTGLAAAVMAFSIRLFESSEQNSVSLKGISSGSFASTRKKNAHLLRSVGKGGKNQISRFIFAKTHTDDCVHIGLRSFPGTL
jgi:hypothetical protein